MIQSTRLEVDRLGERAFELTEHEWREQHHQSQQEMNYFMTQIGEALKNRPSDEDDA